MASQESLESNRAVIDAWSYWARRANCGEVLSLPGLEIAWSHISWPLCNVAILSRPVSCEADFAQRLEAATAFAGEHGDGWVFVVCIDFLPARIRGRVREICHRQGLEPEPLTGMLAQRLRPARRPFPALEYRRVEDRRTRRAAADINCAAYGLPPEWGREAFDVDARWDEASFGYVAYVESRAVATSTTVVLDGCLYVGFVATLPEFQRRGYGEAVMRHSLEQAGELSACSPTALHATEAGAGLYRAMGYRSVADFVGFVSSG